MNFSKELLFAVGFIVVMIIFIQFVSYRMLQKKIKLEVAKQFLIEKKKMSFNQHQQYQQQQQNSNTDLNNNIETNNKEEDMETFDIDTPSENDIDSNADSYVNPLHSEKNVTDTDEE
jgi:hypothetical protein